MESLDVFRRHFEQGTLPSAGELSWPPIEQRLVILEALAVAQKPEVEAGLLFVVEEAQRSLRWRERARSAFRAMALARRGRVRDDAGTLEVTRIEVERLTGDIEHDAIKLRAVGHFGPAQVLARPSRIGGAGASRVLLDCLCRDGVLSRALADALASAMRRYGTRGVGAHPGLESGQLQVVADALATLAGLRSFLESLGRRAGSQQGRSRWREHVAALGAPRSASVTVDGIGRSGELARVLPSELATLRRPILRTLFLARWSERSLAAYDATAQETELSSGAARGGPVVVLLDTSGSMLGPSELVGKGVVLQMLSLAFQSRRQVVVLHFSGPGQLLEYRLSHDAKGLQRALELLAKSFYGGTVMDDGITRALALIDEEAELRDADLLVVTDDFFQVSEVCREALARSKGAGLRCAGLSCTSSVERLRALGADPAVTVEEWVAASSGPRQT